MRLSTLALGGLLLATMGPMALAQAPQPAPPSPISPLPGEAPPALGDAPEENPFTLANIDPTLPFGQIDVEAATNPDALAAWEETLSEGQITELDQRCEVISQATDFPAEPRAFCDMWLTVRADEMGDPALAPVTIPEPGPGVVQQPAPGAPAAP
ncbi:MAG: hypothetical protein IT535_11210 [Bauldia sp.]|nr:hypothetical protein [Bauldia sp.]